MKADALDDVAVRRREAIVDAAERCVKANGLHALKLRDVARECEQSLGNLYNYFENKEAIVQALVERHIERFITMALTCKEKHPPANASTCERIQYGLGHVVDAYLDPDSARVMLFIASEALVNERIRDMMTDANRRMTNFVMDLILNDFPETSRKPERSLLEVQVVLIRSVMESARSILMFNRGVDRKLMRQAIIDRLTLILLFDRAEWQNLTVQEFLGEVLEQPWLHTLRQCDAEQSKSV